MAKPILRSGYTKSTTAKATSITVTGCATAADECLVVLVMNDSTDSTQDTFNTPSGWTRITEGGDGTSDAHVAAFYKFSTSSTPQNVTVTMTSSLEAVGFMLSLSGVSASNTVYGSRSATGANSGVYPSSNTCSVPSGRTADMYSIMANASDGGDCYPFLHSDGGIVDEATEDVNDGNSAAGGWSDLPSYNLSACYLYHYGVSDGYAIINFSLNPVVSIEIAPKTFTFTKSNVDLKTYKIPIDVPSNGPTPGSLIETIYNPIYGDDVGDEGNFGQYNQSSCSVSDTYILIGSSAADSGQGVVYLYDVDGTYLHTFTNPGYVGQKQNMGRVTALNSTHAFCSAPGTFIGGASAGGVVYKFNLSTKALDYTYVNPSTLDGTVSDDFGQCIGVNDDYFVASAPDEGIATDPSGSYGAVYVYDLTDDLLDYTIYNPDLYTSTYDTFGFKIALCGDLCVVGAPNEDDASGTSAGMALVFDCSDGTTLYTKTNENEYGTSAGDRYGYSVGINSTHFLVCAMYEGPSLRGFGYLYDLSTGNLVKTLEQSGTSAFYMGNECAMTEDHAFIFSIYHDSSEGGIFVFDLATGEHIDTLVNPDVYTSTGDKWGHISPESFSDNILVIPAEDEDNASVTDIGVAYILNGYGPDNGATDNYKIIEGSDVDFKPGPYEILPKTFEFLKTDLWATENTVQIVPKTFTFSKTALTLTYETRNIDIAPKTFTFTKTGLGFGRNLTIYIEPRTLNTTITTVDNPNNDGASSDLFGTSVGMSDTQYIVGAPEDGTSGETGAGVAYVYNLSDDSIEYTLTDPNDYDTAAGDAFGSAVDINSTYALVSAPEEDSATYNTVGVAYLISLSTGNVVYTLDNPSPSTGSEFGSGVSISDDYSAVGSHNDDTAGSDSGAVHVFDNSDGSLVQSYYPSASSSAHIGALNTFAVSDEYIAIGNTDRSDQGQLNSGAVFIYDHVTETQRAVYNPNDYGSSGGDLFGSAVALTNEYLIVGASGETDPSNTWTNAGVVYVYNLLDLSLAYSIPHPNEVGISGGERFGQTLYATEEYLIVGAPGEYDPETGTQAWSGAAYVFNIGNGDLLQTIYNPNTYGVAQYDYFGDAVSINNEEAIVAAPRTADADGSLSGSTNRFKNLPPGKIKRGGSKFKYHHHLPIASKTFTFLKSDITLTSSGKVVYIDPKTFTFTKSVVNFKLSANVTGILSDTTVLAITGFAQSNVDCTGVLSEVSVSSIVGSSLGDSVTSSVLNNVTASSISGSASVDVSVTGTLGLVSASSITGSSTASSTTTGTLLSVTASTIASNSIGDSVTSGSLIPVTVSSITGSADVSETGNATGALVEATASAIEVSVSADSSVSGAMTSVSASVVEGSAIGSITANATGTLSNVQINEIVGSAIASSQATGLLTTLNISAITGSGTSSGSATGVLLDVTTSSISGASSGSAITSGNLSTANVSNISGSASVSIIATGSLVTIKVGTVAGSSNADSLASGTIPAAGVVPPNGIASTEQIAAGSLRYIVVSPLASSASADGTASGALLGVTVSSISGTASVDAHASGVLFEVTASVISGSATGSLIANANASGNIIGVFVSSLTGSASNEPIASGVLSQVLVQSVNGSATSSVNATASLANASMLPIEGEAEFTFNGDASGALSDVQTTTILGSAISGALGEGSIAGISISSTQATGSGDALTSGELNSVSVSNIDGTAWNADTGAAFGELGYIQVDAVIGSANGIGNGNAIGSLADINVSVVDGSALAYYPLDSRDALRFTLSITRRICKNVKIVTEIQKNGILKTNIYKHAKIVTSIKNSVSIKRRTNKVVEL